jgi:hypothetical protein
MNPLQLAVDIHGNDGLSGVISSIAKGLLGLNVKVNDLEKGMGRFKLAVAGAASVMVGLKIGEGIFKLGEHAENYVSLLEQAKVKGMDLVEIAKLEASARETSAKVLTSTYEDNMKSAMELRTVFANTSDAYKYLPKLQMMTMGLQAAKNAEGGQMSDEQASNATFSAAKFGEMVGASNDPSRFNKLMDGVFQATMAFAGKVTPADFLQAIKTSGVAGNVFDDKFLLNVLPTLIQELKGGSGNGGGVGVGLGALNRMLVNGRLDHKAAQGFEKYGLLNTDSIIYNKIGQIKGLKAGGVKGHEIAAANDDDWFQKVYLPGLAAHGVNISDQKAVHAVNAEVFGGNKKALQMTDLMTSQHWKFERDERLEKSALTSDKAYSELVNGDPAVAKKAFHAQISNLETTFGNLLLTPAVIQMVTGLATAINQFAIFIKNHPTAGKWILGIAAGLGVLSTVLGVAMIGMAAAAIGLTLPIALVIGEWVLFGAAIVAVGAMIVGHWGSISTYVISAIHLIELEAYKLLSHLPGFLGGNAAKEQARIAGVLVNNDQAQARDKDAREKDKQAHEAAAKAHKLAEKNHDHLVDVQAANEKKDNAAKAAMPDKNQHIHHTTNVKVTIGDAGIKQIAAMITADLDGKSGTRGISGPSSYSNNIGGPLPMATTP